ncbi:MAG: methylenetetrahydrofolate reductase C-terminal domain-containing protein [Alphaproteobacteria bacterium]|jgi:hypothetical protein|nr:methylenetetrahydrofolate reductase C-terminal domain-containing protein [Alphaproteobacteria bacterium]
MYVMRRWATRNARLLEAIYLVLAKAFHAFDPLWGWVGFHRLETSFAALEAWCKGALFDCNMCGRCVLSVTGMTCPMNCPKGIRNGPCGGVRANGHCEVRPDMPCVWVEAWSGATRMRHGMRIQELQEPCDFSTQGTSAWLRLSAENLARRAAGAQGVPAERQGMAAE